MIGRETAKPQIAFAACVLLAAGLSYSVAEAAIAPAERQVLLNLYTDTVGEGWADFPGWNGPPGTECSWYGVTCDASQTTIISIDLGNNLLRGSLPSISALSHLQYFNVGNGGNNGGHFLNSISGDLPSLNGLHDLQVFIANNQNFTGAIPSLAGLTNLTRFEVPRSRLTGPIPALAGLGKLTYFDVGFNQLTGSIPALSELTNLTTFRIGENQLEGGIPGLSQLPALSIFDASGNRLTGGIPQLTGHNQLQQFTVGTNQLTGPVPSLSGLVNLQYFVVSANHLTGAVPDLSDTQQLRQFLVSGNQLTGAAPAPPSQLGSYSAQLCPNQLVPASDPPSAIDLAWNIATGITPWSQKCSQTPAVTATWNASSHNPSFVGQAVTFTASVYSGMNPTGSVTFIAAQPLHDGQTVLCANVPLNGGSASCTYGDFAAGTSNVVTATYSGDANNTASSDSSVDQAVYYAIAERTSGNPSQLGQPIDIVATVGGGKLGDTITFFDGITTLCSSVPVVLVGGTALAHCVTAFDRLGDHSLTARDDQGPLGGTSDQPLIQSVVAATAFDANQFALTGSWFNAATAGQGLTVEVYPDFVSSGKGLLAGGWFTYDTSGNQRWLFLQGSMSSTHGATIDVGIYASSGGIFDAPPATSAVNYGSGLLTFYDCSHATLAFTFIDGRSGTIPYERLTSPSACTTAVPAVVPQSLPANYNDVLHSGNWFNSLTSGQGLVIDVVPAQNTFVATWYTYAPQSEGATGESAQRWFSIQSAYTPTNLSLKNLPIYATRGGKFNDPAPISFSQVGTADMDFTSCNTMTLHYTFTSGEFAGRNGTIDENTIAAVAGCK